MMSFFDKVNFLALRTNKTVFDVCHDLSIPESEIDKWLEDIEPDLETGLKITDYFQINPLYFVTGQFCTKEKTTWEEIELLYAYYKMSDVYKPVFVNCLKTCHELSNPKNINAVNKQGIKHGFCYIGIDLNWKGFFKIGKTIDPTCKSRQSKTINPNYKILYRTRNVSKDCYELESEIHNLLRKFKVQSKNNGCNEWFKLSDEELNDIINKYNFVKLETLFTSSNK